MAKKLLLVIGLLSLFVWNVEARKRSPFRLENDTILHICSNLSEMDCMAYGASDRIDQSDSPSDYFTTYPYWRIKNIVIDEGVDSVYFGLYLISAKRLSIPSSLKYLYFSQEVPPGLEEVRLNAKNPYYRWENGTLYNCDKTQLYFMLPSAVDSVLQFPETVEHVWNLPERYYPKDTLYLKDLPSRHWEGYLERYPKDIHYSKIVFPRHCKKYPEYLPSCDSLIILSEHCPEWLEEVAENVSYLYCHSDSVLLHILQENAGRSTHTHSTEWNFRDKGKFHSPNYDIRKRDTSWMRESYRLICVTENGDTLVGVDSIPSNWRRLGIEGIADENVRFDNQDGRYCFYVATYDTLYRLPLEVYKKPTESELELIEYKSKPKWSFYGEVRDSVFTIREGVDSLFRMWWNDLPPLQKAIIPKSMHYIEDHITCDSVFIYSDSLCGGLGYNTWYFIDADYYYVENEQLYLSLRRWLKRERRSAVAYSPNADIRKRDMTLQQNMNKPVWKDGKGNELMDMTCCSAKLMAGLHFEIEGINPQNLWAFSQRKNIENGGIIYEMEYSVWTYDTLLPLQQKDTLKLVKRDGTPWTGGYNRKECVLYYVPKGESRLSSLESRDSIRVWRSGDTIPRRYANRLAFGFILTNGEYDPSLVIKCGVIYLDKRNYFGNGELIKVDDGIWESPRQYKELWLEHVLEYSPNCIPKVYPPMHFYVGR
ncbi:MAG: hypothetical protein K6F48_08190 [Paludibacteraceae bacterium]|nr:hypothetical protein [Paludibacteraceae bacterium]